jgi:UDP-N-acetylmuramoylalanine--D-glutamate ligase
MDSNFNFTDKNVAILGWGINGLDAADFLMKQGAKVTIFDEKEGSELDFSGFDTKRAELVLGKHYLDDGLKDFDFVIRSPGVYRYIPRIVEAEEAGVAITSVVKLFFDLSPAKIIGVTGTKGKGTTSTLIYEILKNAGKEVYLAGNIGAPMLDLLPKLTKDSWVVLELSSFQLIDMSLSPHIAVVLNITEDHMDWHKSREEYINAKKNIVLHQTEKDFAVINLDYSDSRKFKEDTSASVFWFSSKKKVRGTYVNRLGEIILNSEEGNEEKIGETKQLLLRGKHHWENVCAAVCASTLTGIFPDAIREAVFSFKGLEHRLELVKETKGIKFYNDSFSTNPQTTIAAIRSFGEPLTLILGGSDKGLNYDEMGREIVKQGNVKNVLLIGQISDIIEKSIKSAGYKGEIIRLGKTDMGGVVQEGMEITPGGGVVLLSPATASFDMFANYKERGKQFKEAVDKIAK